MKSLFLKMKSLLKLTLFLLFDRVVHGEDSSMLESPAMNQLPNYANTHPNNVTEFARTATGTVYPSLTASLKVGPRGPILLQDRFLIEKLQLFNRERIPERVCHAKGTGAFGFFEVTKDISQYTQANFLQPGKRTKVAVRFSGSSGESGSPDTYFDMKGFAVKFYTEDGIHDLVGINFPIIHLRNPMLFPDLIHSKKRNPQTNIPDFNAYLDFVSERSEMAFFILYMFKDMTNTKSYRCMKGYAIHTFKMVNSEGEVVYVKFHWTPQQKEEFYTFDEAIQMYANNSDVLVQDLFDSIANKNYPKWNILIQVMTFEQAENHYENPFDPTKLWKPDEYPLMLVGEITLNENPQNFFAQIEQIAFSPSNMVRGIEPGPDALLQARMFAYQNAQLYRLGTNFAQIPVNSCPFAQKTYSRDGHMQVGMNGGSVPNYYPNTFNGPNSNDNKSFKESVYLVTGDVDRFEEEDDDDFSHANFHWVNAIGPEEKQRVIATAAKILSLADRRIQKKFLDNIVYKIHKEFGDGVRAAINL